MLRTSPPANWSQISKEIPSLLVIMSHKEWDSGEDGIGEKGMGSQTSVTLADAKDFHAVLSFLAGVPAGINEYNQDILVNNQRGTYTF